MNDRLDKLKELARVPGRVVGEVAEYHVELLTLLLEVQKYEGTVWKRRISFRTPSTLQDKKKERG